MSSRSRIKTNIKAIIITFRYVGDHRLCCFFQWVNNCVVLNEQPVLFQCGSLMQNKFLRAFMWLFGLSAMSGNLFVIFWRLRAKPDSKIQLNQAIFAGNLAVSDLFMAIYMLLLATADVYYGDEFYKFSDDWRLSISCRIANGLVLLSSETSLFLLMLITLDRFLGLVFPFSTHQFTKFSTIIAVVAVWCITLPMSILASTFADPESNVYELSDVCIGLPLTMRPASYEIKSDNVGDDTTDVVFEIPSSEGSKKSRYFSLVIFLGINFFLTILIIVFYVTIYVSVIKSRREAQESPRIKEELVIASRMTALVMTNCMCWLPVIILGILSQSEYILVSLDVYVWAVVFILPINASINPYLYTIIFR